MFAGVEHRNRETASSERTPANCHHALLHSGLQKAFFGERDEPSRGGCVKQFKGMTYTAVKTDYRV